MFMHPVVKIFHALLLLYLCAKTVTSTSNLPNNLFWFIQVSDIHLSLFEDPGRAADLENFFRTVVPIVKPEVLIVSGDLVDSKSKSKLSSTQFEQEWIMYKEIIENSSVLKVTKIMDIRGNHDMFGVFGENEEQDYFQKYAVQGKQNHSSYILQVNKPFGRYGFVFADTCPTRGARFPLNFFGEVTESRITQFTKLADYGARNNHTFWIGHYPTSTISSPLFNLRHLLGKSAYAYLCGHLHTALGLVPHMYTAQPEGYLELELGDWRAHRFYRVVAVDHDLVSFVDNQFPTAGGGPGTSPWPIVLITNPKDAKFMMPEKEPVKRIVQSSYIRILAWSNTTIDDVSVFIDGRFVGKAFGSGPLYTLPWRPSLLTGAHVIQVGVTDRMGNKRIVSHTFTVDGIPIYRFSYGARWILQSKHTVNLCVVFYASWIFVMLFLMVPLCFTENCILECGSQSSFCRGIYRFSRSPVIIGPVLAFLIYELFGPILLGFIIPNHFGAVFSFGFVVGATFVQEALTYQYELLQLWSFFLFVILPDIQSAENPKPKLSRHQWSEYTVMYVCTAIFTVTQLLLIAFTVAIPFGVATMFLSIGRWFPLIVSWYLAYRIPLAP